MTVLACLEAVALVVIVALFLADRKRADEATVAERRELLTRIQRPELVPVVEREPFVIPEPELDEFDLVGAIQDPPKED